jgi:hypothetical protein
MALTDRDIQQLLIKHLKPALQKLEKEGLELVVIGIEKNVLGGRVGIAGTVRSPAEVLAVLIQAAGEMRGVRMPGVPIEPGN